jgi:ADP-ribose pyrophosphatase YjhB (NUDIX family)
MKFIDKLAWIEIIDRKILSTRNYGKNVFYIPGGKRELNESDEHAISREILEELNVTINLKTLKYIGIFEAQAHGHDDGVFVKMTCYSSKYSGELAASSEIEVIEWLTYADKGKISEVDKLIFDFLYSQNLID